MNLSFTEQCYCIKNIEVQPKVFFETGMIYPCSINEEWEGTGILVKHPQIENIRLIKTKGIGKMEEMKFDSWFFCHDLANSNTVFPHFHEYFTMDEQKKEENKIFEPLPFDMFEIDSKFRNAIKTIYENMGNINKKTHAQMKYELKTIKNICDICEIIGIETRKSFKESVRGIAVIRKNNMTKQKEEQKEEWTTIIVIDNGLTYPGASEIAREMRAKWREEFIPPNNCIGYKIATRCLECRTVSYLPTKCCLSCNSNYDNNDHVLIKFNRDNLLETVRNIKVPEDDRWFDLVRFNEYIATGNPQIDVIMSEGGIKEIKYAFFTKEDFLL